MRRQEEAMTRFTWTGDAGNGRFADPDNWDPAGGPPSSNDDDTIPNGDAATIDQRLVQPGQSTRAATIAGRSAAKTRQAARASRSRRRRACPQNGAVKS